ncbi:MAG: RNA polymerase factor sigma-54 [Pikeienuella sp.]
MQVAPRLELKQSQQLVMTPQLQQAIRLLQMSHLEAAAFVAEEVEKNPLLKVDDGAAETPAPPETRGAEAVDRALADGGAEAALDTGFDSGRENLHDAPWSGARGGGLGADGDLADIGERTAAKISLRDHLLPQIAASGAPQATRTAAALLVDELDEGGYLRPDPETPPAEGFAAALALLQNCEPTGIGARDLKECLALQLRERDRLDPAMAALLDNLEDLAAARISRLRAACGVDDEDLRDMIAEIRELDPRPGAAFTVEIAQAVTPDVFVRRQPHGGWVVELNADASPKLSLDRAYMNRLSASGVVETRAFAASCRQNADWLIRALEQRAETILKVATEIVRRQAGFFHDGVGALTPMTLKSVAEEIGMHESTVSRVTSNKFLACERGVLELKFFFSQGLAASDGGEAVSAAAVRHRIKALIDKEDKARALSDDRIVTLLKQSGVDVARRTVAKYREAMNIPSSAQRKRMQAAALSP